MTAQWRLVETSAGAAPQRTAAPRNVLGAPSKQHPCTRQLRQCIRVKLLIWPAELLHRQAGGRQLSQPCLTSAGSSPTAPFRACIRFSASILMAAMTCCWKCPQQQGQVCEHRLDGGILGAREACRYCMGYRRYWLVPRRAVVPAGRLPRRVPVAAQNMAPAPPWQHHRGRSSHRSVGAQGGAACAHQTAWPRLNGAHPSEVEVGARRGAWLLLAAARYHKMNS